MINEKWTATMDRSDMELPSVRVEVLRNQNRWIDGDLSSPARYPGARTWHWTDLDLLSNFRAMSATPDRKLETHRYGVDEIGACRRCGMSNPPASHDCAS